MEIKLWPSFQMQVQWRRLQLTKAPVVIQRARRHCLLPRFLGPSPLGIDTGLLFSLLVSQEY